MSKTLILLVLVHLSLASNVVELNPSNFNPMVQDGKDFWIVEFYSPSCPFCQEFVPEYEATAGALKGTNIKVGRVDAVEYGEFSGKFGVRSYPTVKFFRPGNLSYEDYHGARNSADIVNTAKKFAGAARRRRRRSTTQTDRTWQLDSWYE